MSTFCNQCGSPIPDDSAFCPSCGTPVPQIQEQQPVSNEQPPVSSQPTYSSPNGSFQSKPNIFSNPLVLFGGIGAAVLLFIIIICIVAFSSKPYEKCVKKYVKAFNKGDAEKVVSFLPYEFVDEDDIKDNIDDLIDTYDDTFDDIKDEDDDYNVSLEIKSSKEIDEDDYEDYSIEDLEDSLDEKITKAYKVKAKCKIEYDGDTDSDTLTFICVKIDGDWYLTPTSLSQLFFYFN